MDEKNTTTSTNPVDKDSLLLELSTGSRLTINETKYIVNQKIFHAHSDDPNARYNLEVHLFHPTKSHSLKTDTPISTTEFSKHAKSGDYVFMKTINQEGYFQVASKSGNINNSEYTLLIQFSPIIAFP